MRQLLLILILLFAELSVAQTLTTENIDSDMLGLILTDIYEQMAENDVDVDFEELQTVLLDLHDNPINLNTATQQDLERLFFLSDKQIDDILLFVYKQPIHALYELRLIGSLADYEIRNMLPFVVAQQQQTKDVFYWRDMFHYSKQEVDIRFDARNIENSKVDPFYASLKYRFKYKNKVDVGLVAERDPQEPFYFKGKTYGADFYGGWLQINDIGKLRTLTVGDFRASFGQGLVLNTNMNYCGKTAYLTNSGFRQYGLKSKTSTAEYDFLRGAGATLRLGKIDLTMLYSARKVDGNANAGVFSSIQKTGYHRTESELNAKRNVWQQVIGMNATLRLNKARIGITATENLLGGTLVPRTTYYNHNYFTGKRQAAIGVNYDWRFMQFQLFGEIATAQNTQWGIGNITGFRYIPISGLTLTALYRYYSPTFDNLLSSGFAETSRLNDEHGVLVGMDIQLFKRWQLSLYGDYFYFSGPKYGIRIHGSHGYDVCTILNYYAAKHVDMQWKLRAKHKTDNKYSLRYLLTTQVCSSLLLKTSVEGNIVIDSLAALPTLGGVVSEQVEYHAQKLPIVLQLRAELFYAKNYSNRIYLYENDVLYAFSIPMLYGSGARWYMNFRYKINNSFSLYLKASQTIYLDSNERALTLNSTRSEIHSMLRITW